VKKEVARATIHYDSCGAAGAIAGFLMPTVVHIDSLTTLCMPLGVEAERAAP
jgi:hypothetical protein